MRPHTDTNNTDTRTQAFIIEEVGRLFPHVHSREIKRALTHTEYDADLAIRSLANRAGSGAEAKALPAHPD